MLKWSGDYSLLGMTSRVALIQVNRPMQMILCAYIFLLKICFKSFLIMHNACSLMFIYCSSTYSRCCRFWTSCDSRQKSKDSYDMPLGQPENSHSLLTSFPSRTSWWFSTPWTLWDEFFRNVFITCSISSINLTKCNDLKNSQYNGVLYSSSSASNDIAHSTRDFHQTP